MMMPRKLQIIVLVTVVAGAPLLSSAQQFSPVATVTASSPTLWIEPADIKTRNLYYGPGGEEGQPREPLTFVKEDDAGTSPKFEVKDANGDKWKAKLGLEAQPETVATRLLWSVGFVANENYYNSIVNIQDLPRLKRGQNFVSSEGVKGVRLQTNGHSKKIGDWSWRHNAFKSTREFNGLRVMMALLSNVDLKDENNAILDDTKNPGYLLYEVSDLGASFGRSGRSYTDRISKHNLAAYRRSKFISKTTSDYVDFAFPTHPPFLYAFNLPFFIAKMRTRWIGKHIPRQDAKWVGSLLAQLSEEQIEDAFRAGGYSQQEVVQYAAAVKARIAQLERL
jgi:hypothetical protein